MLTAENLGCSRIEQNDVVFETFIGFSFQFLKDLTSKNNLSSTCLREYFFLKLNTRSLLRPMNGFERSIKFQSF